MAQYKNAAAAANLFTNERPHRGVQTHAVR